MTPLSFAGLTNPDNTALAEAIDETATSVAFVAARAAGVAFNHDGCPMAWTWDECCDTCRAEMRARDAVDSVSAARRALAAAVYHDRNAIAYARREPSCMPISAQNAALMHDRQRSYARDQRRKAQTAVRSAIKAAREARRRIDAIEAS